MRTTKRARRDAKQLFRLCLANGLLDEDRVRSVVTGVGQTRYRSRFVVLSLFRRLVELYIARHKATIESANPLPADFQTVVQTRLTRRYGSGLTTAFSHRPRLIGGIRIQVGCDVYDGSVRGRLEALENSFGSR